LSRTTPARPPAVLMLEDGRTFRGEAFGADRTLDGSAETFGEAVFATGMTGYQETLTDPSYAAQIVVQTAPHIGNTGVNDEDPESRAIWVAGYVVRDPSRIPSNWRSQRTLEDELRAQGIVGLAGIDTRALTRHLRERGAMRGAIAPAEAQDGLLDRILASPGMVGANLAPKVSTQQAYTVTPASVGLTGEPRFRVSALDLGIKSRTPFRMAERGIEVTVFPATATGDDLLATRPDGVFLSNGPGDPATTEYAVKSAQQVLESETPLFGICFGNQILGRALGFGTYKLRYGHRGINQPVMDRATGRVAVTSHNHGFAVDAPLEGTASTPYGDVEVSHVALNDNVVEGLRLLDLPAFSVQYHPESAPGPHDADSLFDSFVELMHNPSRKARS
jgi:carbamoyl-phosphate synthase small subunit